MKTGYVHIETNAVGIPVVAGISVHRLYAWYTGGVNLETLRKRYPRLALGPLHAALAYAFDHEAEMQSLLERERQALARASATT
jgi:uncharacterized protein (DUF433 family)